jgi:hypothetical protein
LDIENRRQQMTEQLKQRMLDADVEVAEVIPGSRIYAATGRVNEIREAILAGVIAHAQRVGSGRKAISDRI